MQNHSAVAWNHRDMERTHEVNAITLRVARKGHDALWSGNEGGKCLLFFFYHHHIFIKFLQYFPRLTLRKVEAGVWHLITNICLAIH